MVTLSFLAPTTLVTPVDHPMALVSPDEFSSRFAIRYDDVRLIRKRGPGETAPLSRPSERRSVFPVSGAGRTPKVAGARSLQGHHCAWLEDSPCSGSLSVPCAPCWKGSVATGRRAPRGLAAPLVGCIPTSCAAPLP